MSRWSFKVVAAAAALLAAAPVYAGPDYSPSKKGQYPSPNINRLDADSIIFRGTGSTGEVPNLTVNRRPLGSFIKEAPDGKTVLTPDAVEAGTLKGDGGAVTVTPSGTAPDGSLQKLLFDRLLNNGTGNIDGMDITIDGGVPRSMRARAGDRVTLEDYGGAGDWNGTTGTDNLTAWAKATALGKCLDLLPGRYWFSSQPAAIVNRRACIQGRGRAASALIVPGAGIEVSQNDYSTPVYFDSLSVQTQGQELGAGIKVSQPQPDGVTSINRPNIWMSNLDIGGVNQANSGFTRCIHFYNAQTPEGNDVRCRGRQDTTLPTMARFTKQKEGMLAEYTGPQIGGAPRFKMFNNQSGQYGVRIVGRAEGGIFSHPMIEAVLVGIANFMTDTRPGFEVRGGHINATLAPVWLVNTPNCFVDGVQIYKFDKSGIANANPENLPADVINANGNPASLPKGFMDAGETVGVLLDRSNTCVIGRNVFNVGAFSSVDANGAYTAVRLFNSYGNSIAPQRMLYGTRGVSLMGVSQSNDVARPEITVPVESASRPYRLFANDNTGIQNNNFLGGGVRVNSNASNANSAVYNIVTAEGFPVSLQSFNVEAGQRIRVDASVLINNGPTANATFALKLLKANGSATGGWVHNAGQINQTTPPIAANGDYGTAVSAEFVVTAGGSFQPAIAVAGPAGSSIAVGNAQMSAVLP